MNDLFYEAFRIINLPVTTLLIVVILYWISVVIGALDLGFLDIDLDLDGEADIQFDHHVDFDISADADIDIDADADADVSGGFASALAFFNFGSIPVMILLSIVIFFMWSSSILINHYYQINAFWLATLLLIPNFIVMLFVAKFMTAPLKKLFLKMNEDPNAKKSIIGEICTISISILAGKKGQAKINSPGAPVLISVISTDSDILKGEKAIVLEKIPKKNVYLVEKLDLHE